MNPKDPTLVDPPEPLLADPVSEPNYHLNKQILPESDPPKRTMINQGTSVEPSEVSPHAVKELNSDRDCSRSTRSVKKSLPEYFGHLPQRISANKLPQSSQSNFQSHT